MQLRKALVGTAALAAALGGAVLGAPAASAHDAALPVYHCGVYPQLSTQCGYGGVTNGHTRVYACDTYSDGIGVRTEYELRTGWSSGVDDANGSDKGCSSITPGTASNPVVKFRVCQKSQVWFCTNWGTV
ncbi:hypothetical protein AB5J62_19275 [Amycolatopsis sp. cg5]|uniref:hypothetical protein n=1 Tax=Amycolatopsis sp. cg5 TaxID=3238802 RepID=UPI003524EA9C